MRDLRFALFVLTLGAASLSAQVPAADWAQWRGANRSGVSAETGLLKQWPPAGPPLAWSASNIGAGYGSVAVAGDRVFVQGLRDRQSVVFSLTRVMAGRSVEPLGPSGSNDRGSGPRAPRPSMATALRVTESGPGVPPHADGSVSGSATFQGSAAPKSNGVSESPLVDGSGSSSPLAVGAPAWRRSTDDRQDVWTTKDMSEDAGYASPIVADVQGVRTIMTLTADAGVGVRASDGKLMWRYQPAANGTANITTPVYFDSKVFFSSAYGTGGGLVGLRAAGGELRAQEIYFTREMQNHHGGIVLVGGYLFASTTRF